MSIFDGRPLRYLIGADVPNIPLMYGVVTEYPYDTPKSVVKSLGRSKNMPNIGYINALDEEMAEGKNIFGPPGRYGPYVHGSTSDDWNEGQMVPGSHGWTCCLVDQFNRWKPLAPDAIEIDNLDSYPLKFVLRMFDMAAEHGFNVIAKNPLNVEGAHFQVLEHRTVVGAIIEAYCGTCDQMQQLRKDAGKPNLPVWFVSNRKERHWANERARALGEESPWKNMSVSWCESFGDYSSFMTLRMPSM